MSCYFISGHRNLTEEEFKEHYESRIRKLLWDTNNRFVVCDYQGADTMAQDYFKENDAKNVVVFHTHKDSRYNAGFPTIGGFDCDISRDSAGTDVSDFDILWVRPGNIGSGTHQNEVRRQNPANTYIKECSKKKRKIVQHVVSKYKKRNKR